jgi:hypothetical protein
MSSLTTSEMLKSLATPSWDEKPSTYPAYRRKIITSFVKKDLAAILFHKEMKLPELKDPDAGGDGGTTPTKASANIKVFAMLQESISDTLFQLIEDEHSAAAKADSDNEALLLGYDAMKLWTAIEKKANGAINETSGYDFQADVDAWAWPITDPNSGSSLTLQEQCATAIKQVSAFVDRAVRLKNADFPFTTALGIHKVLKHLPASLKHNLRQYRAFKTLPKLAQELAVDAAALDQTATTPQHACKANRNCRCCH